MLLLAMCSVIAMIVRVPVEQYLVGCYLIYMNIMEPKGRFQLSIFLASGGNEEIRQIENPKVKSLCLSSFYRLMLLSATTSLVCHLRVFTRRGRVAHKTEHISVILRIVQIQC
jgi:hypothetical protein